MRLSTSSDVWILPATLDDLRAGAWYASISMPFTFNRMSLLTNSQGQQSRALNVAKGIVVQSVLSRLLSTHGVSHALERKSHRDTDIFDLEVASRGITQTLDIKSFHVYTDYLGTERAPLTPELIIQNKDNPGPQWRTFFPMLVPYDQINTGKDLYAFAISASVDPRREIDKQRTAYAITAFPYGEWLGFLSSKTLCFARERSGSGFRLAVTHHGAPLANGTQIIAVGEWDGDRQIEKLDLRPNDVTVGVKTFSCISSFRMLREQFSQFNGQIRVSVYSNDFDLSVADNNISNVNRIPRTPLTLRRADFCNLVLPSDLVVYFLGWLSREQFVERFQAHPAWIGPKDNSINENQLWESISRQERRDIERTGCGNWLRGSQPVGGWMRKGYGSSGACCYTFPYVGVSGGVKQTNLYVLPGDLNKMQVLGR